VPDAEALTLGVPKSEPEGAFEGLVEGEGPLEVQPEALTAAEAVDVGHGVALPVPPTPPLALPLGEPPPEGVPAGEALLAKEADAQFVGTDVTDSTDELLIEPLREAVEEPDAEAFAVAEGAPLRDASGEAEVEAVATSVEEGSGDPEVDAEWRAVEVPLKTAVAVPAGDVETQRVGAGELVTGGEGDSGAEPLGGALPLGTPLAVAPPLGDARGEVDDIMESVGAPEAETPLAEAQTVNVSVGYDGKPVADNETEGEGVP